MIAIGEASLVTSDPLSDREGLAGLLQHLLDAELDLGFDRWGRTDREARPLSRSLVPEILEAWDGLSLDFRSKRRRLHVSVSPSSVAGGAGWITARYPASVPLHHLVERLTTRLAVRFRVEFGILELLGKVEASVQVANGAASYVDRARKSWTLCVGPNRLEDGIPGPFWATFLGKPYLDLIGAERVFSAPAAEVSRVGSDCALIRLTDDPTDPVRYSAEFTASRERVREHLGQQYFRRQATGEGVDDPVVPPVYLRRREDRLRRREAFLKEHN